MAYSPPKSILIVGSGVFGLSTAEALSRRPEFAATEITVVDRGSDGPADDGTDGDEDEARHFPARDAASIDSSRIIRPDYADPAYAALANEAQARWRGVGVAPGADYMGGAGRYRESGLVVIADADAADKPAGLKKTGMDYVRESWANVQAMAQTDAYLGERLTLLPDAAAIGAAIGTGGATGSWGYCNGASGWAHAEQSMAWLYARVRRTGRVAFVHGRVVALARAAADDGHSLGQTITGVTLSDGRTLSADLVVVAAGAWTESLLDASSVPAPPSGLAGSLAATGQAVAYLPLSDAEHARIAHMPVVLNLSTGLFIIPPAPDSRELKVARHAYGYINPVPSTTTSATTSATATLVSAPWTQQDDPALAIPAEAAADLRRGLRAMVPLPGLPERPFAKTRLCWYTDTPTADFLIDYHPAWPGLFFATGGSGHGFKFLPVLGDKIVDCIARQPPAAFRQKWAWKHRPAAAAAAAAAAVDASSWKAVLCDDGSRGGQPGLILREELAKSSA